ncbi:hypothetical protein [Actinospongicola halichondriae]|uniref:hypothetical protein n=1 Tax=Actinospongicola halichondriae TaxID=3236844 RepID=UPI003D509566
MRRATRMVLVAIAFLAVALMPTSVGAQASDPTVSVDRTGTTKGENLLVTGAGWTPGATVIVELCGHGGIDGSVDCDVAGQRTAGVGPQGNFSVELLAGVPPRPCPCVIKATDQSTQVAATASIAVAGIPTVPITSVDDPIERVIEISAIEIVGERSWTELFGAGSDRVLEITLVNTGSAPVSSPELEIAWGSGSDPSGFVEPPEVEAMAPGETQTVSVVLRRSALTIGEQTAVVDVQGIGVAVSASATTSGYPWGLLVLGLIALQLVALAIRNRVRRRFQSMPDDDPDPLAIEGAMLGLPSPVWVDEEDDADDDVPDEPEPDVLIDLADPPPDGESVPDGTEIPEPSTNGHAVPVVAVPAVAATAMVTVDDDRAREALRAEVLRARAELEESAAATTDDALRQVAEARVEIEGAQRRVDARLAAAAATRQRALDTLTTMRAEVDATVARLEATRQEADAALAESRAAAAAALRDLDAREESIRELHQDGMHEALERLGEAADRLDAHSATTVPEGTGEPDELDLRLADVLASAIASATQTRGDTKS